MNKILVSAIIGVAITAIGLLADLTGILGFLGINLLVNRPTPFSTLPAGQAPPYFGTDSKSQLVAEINSGNNNILSIYSPQNELLWKIDFETKISKAAINDLDGDSKQEIIVGLSEPGIHPGLIIVFDDTGEKISEFNLYEPNIYYGERENKVNIIDFEIANLYSSTQKQILTISNDTYWYPSKLSILAYENGKIREIGKYWNPGLLYTLDIVDLNEDDSSEIIVSGVNNDLQAGLEEKGNFSIIFLLDKQHLTEKEVWYAYVTPSSASITGINYSDTNQDGSLEVIINLSNGCLYSIKITGEINENTQGDTCQNRSELNLLQK